MAAVEGGIQIRVHSRRGCNNVHPVCRRDGARGTYRHQELYFLHWKMGRDSQVEADGGKSLDLSNYPYIFMRWKEQYFVNVGSDCGLTIAGLLLCLLFLW